MPGTWSVEDEKRLLLAVIDTTAKRDWDAVSAVMGDYSAEGCRTVWERLAEKIDPELNANACSQKFNKLKRQSEQLLENAGVNAAPATPVAKKAKSTSSKSTGSGKRKATTPAAADDDDDDGNNVESDDSPAKKKSKMAKDKKNKVNVKDEDDTIVAEKTSDDEAENVEN